MEPISKYNEFISKLKVVYGKSNKIVFLLIADPYNDTIGQYIGRRYRYLHIRTGKDLIFYCPGYTSGIKIGFSHEAFAQFINEFESVTSWKYSGGTNILIMPYKNGELQFDTVYDINLTKMQSEGLLNDYRDFLERLIREFVDPDGFIDSEYSRLQMESLLDNFTSLLPEIVGRVFKQISRSRKIHKNLKLCDIRKKT